MSMLPNSFFTQTCMNFFHLLNTNEDISRTWVMKQFLVPKLFCYVQNILFSRKKIIQVWNNLREWLNGNDFHFCWTISLSRKKNTVLSALSILNILLVLDALQVKCLFKWTPDFSLDASAAFFFFGYSLSCEEQTWVPVGIFIYTVVQGATVNVFNEYSGVDSP